MIYLGINDNHLLCAQWVNDDGKFLLTSVTQKPFQKSIFDSNRTENEIISDINGTLHLIREEISFGGEQVYVTVPDSYCNSALVSFDKDMTDNDGWEFAKWTIDQRWNTDEPVEYFGRSFVNTSNDIYAIRVPTTFTEPLKLAIQELGADTTWMGTESSAFFGLNPNLGSTVFFVQDNGYRYFSYTIKLFQDGFARFYKNDWKIEALNGGSTSKEVFKGALVTAGKLSYRRKKHFEDLRTTNFESLSGIDMEADIIPKSLSEYSLLVLTAIIKGSVEGVAINFFDLPGIQDYRYAKDKDTEKLSKKTASMKKNKKRSKNKDRKFLKFMLYVFFFSIIGSVVTYDQNPDYFTNFVSSSKNKADQLLNSLFQKAIPSIESVESSLEEPEISASQEDKSSGISSESIVTGSDKSNIDFQLQSGSLISSVINALNLNKDYNLLMLSASSGRIDMEFLGEKSLNIPVDSIGDILNISVRQVSGEDQYKHGFLVKYPPVLIKKDSVSNVTLEDLNSFANNVQQVLVKSLPPILDDNFNKTPVILRVKGFDNIVKTLQYLSINSGSNISLDKFVYKTFETGLEPSAFYYIAIIDELNSK